MTGDNDEDYPTYARTYAGLRIYHDKMNPDRIIGMLEIHPSQTQVKGRVQIKPSGRVFTPPIGGWFLST